MSDKLVESPRSQSVSSLDQKELSCGGQPCRKCGACRDWHQRFDSDEIVKRDDASCNCEYMFRHNLVRHPDHQHYSLQSFICMCRDNY